MRGAGVVLGAVWLAAAGVLGARGQAPLAPPLRCAAELVPGVRACSADGSPGVPGNATYILHVPPDAAGSDLAVVLTSKSGDADLCAPLLRDIPGAI